MSLLELPILDRSHFTGHFHRDLRRLSLQTLQINIGLRCNLACNHCHVDSSPARTAPGENMTEPTARKIINWALAHTEFTQVDFTGGSPEMNPNFRWMVERFRAAGWRVMSRCNPTIIDYKGWKTPEDYSWVPGFYAENHVEVVASLPCYTKENVDRQRGRRSYDASISGLRQLNAVGYGSDPDLILNLVYNPTGPHLPPPQAALQGDYKRELRERFGIVFNELWTITNMPIKRWRHELEREGRLEGYMLRLIDAFNESTLPGLMCRHQINISPNGRVYDCDFNQALRLPARGLGSRPVWEIEPDEFIDRLITTADHCYGCTAGTGSSCGGAILS